MSNTKLSAFAKRRRLNDGSAVEAPSSDSSASGAVKTKIAITSKQTRKREIAQVKPLAVEVKVDDAEVSLGENSFEPLVEAQAVRFHGIREIAEVGCDSCKIRLSRGQECSFVGVVRLWVRDGSVEVYGATLNESTEVHTVFSPHGGSPVSITSTSKVAEIQLESVGASDTAAPSSLHLPGIFKFKQTDLSFQIVNFDNHLGIVPRSVAPHDGRFKSTLRRLTSIKNACVFVSGKRSSGTAHVSLELINAMLSNPAICHAEKGVALIDLDQSLPTHTTPGTVSLTYQRGLILGPGYAYPLHGSAERLILVSSIYTGNTDDDGGIEVLKIVENILNSHTEIRKMPIVVRTGKWLATASATTLSNLRTILSPSLILSVDRTKTSSYYEAGVTLAEKATVLESIPELAIQTIPSLTDHRYHLRSHFLLHGYTDNVPTWYRSTADLPETRHLELSIDSSASQLGFLLLSGGMIRADDLADVLTTSLVTIVARNLGGSDQDSAFQIQPFQRGLNLQYIGIAYVENFDEALQIVKLTTNVTNAMLETHQAAGRIIGLVLEKPGPEGQFSRHMLRD